MMIVIAGGIGVGKSAVTDILKKEGATILSADEINRELLNREDYINKIDAYFPGVVKDGRVDKSALRKIIFSNEEERLKLNALSHPLIFAEIKERSKILGGAVFTEVPLLMECGWAEMFDKIWAVTAPYEERIERIMKRDNIDRKYAETMIASQSEEERVLEIADEIILNSGDLEKLNREVSSLYKKYSS